MKPAVYADDAHLLPPRTRTTTTELLRLHSPGVGNEKGTVVSDEGFLQFQCGRGILVLCVETGKKSARLREQPTPVLVRVHSVPTPHRVYSSRALLYAPMAGNGGFLVQG